MRLKKVRLDEAIAGLPSTMDPYTPSARQDVDMTTDTPNPATPGDIPEIGKPSSEPQPLKTADSKAGEGDGSGPGIGMMKHKSEDGAALAPMNPTWEKLALPNKKDIGFKRTDGFMLRIREVESIPGKYLAQLWKEKEVLDKGQVVVPQEEDPIKYIQGMADAMLDDDSERDQQPADDLPPEEQEALGEEPSGDEGSAPGGGGGGLSGAGGGDLPPLGDEAGADGADPAEEELNLDDEEIDFGDDDENITAEDLPGEEEESPLPDLGL